MSQTEEPQLTHHAMLVVWGQFAQATGLIQALQDVPLHQKTHHHRPQSKVLEFLVTILGGMEYLKDISQSAHPLDQDSVVARAWQQTGWADHSGVSRTMSQLTEAEAQAICTALDRVSQPFVDREVELAAGGGRIELDGDLSPRPVSYTSQTYPGAAYGHMLHEQIGLGYQAALVSLRSPTYGRLLLSCEQHPGNTVSANQAERLVQLAEQRIGRRPLRRTDLLEGRIQLLQAPYKQQQNSLRQSEEQLLQAEQSVRSVRQQVKQAQQSVVFLEQSYAERQRIERPNSHLAKARKRLACYQERLSRRIAAVTAAQTRRQRQQGRLAMQEAQLHTLRMRLEHFQHDNCNNPAPVRAIIRLDSGFGNGPNMALLIEMGYEVYSKPFTTWLSTWLEQHAAQETTWQRVGANAEMVAWPSVNLPHFPYPLDVARERFWIGENRYRYSAFLHYGTDSVTANLATWFAFYNARQTIEAGNKEEKQVFEIRHLKIRARPALQLQEAFTLFAANFVRFASRWLAEQCLYIPQGWGYSQQPKVKQQVKVGAQCDAWVSWLGQDCLLRFEEHSVFAGCSLTIKPIWLFQPVLPFTDFCFFSSI